MAVKKFALFLWCISFSPSLLGQLNYSLLDQNPASVRWKQLQVPNHAIQIIYSEDADSLAQLTAHYLEKHVNQVGQTIPSKLHPWKIVLQNRGIYSNGFVSLNAPRAELFTIPTQNPALVGTNEWLEMLVSHETRHMFQNELGRQGLAKVFRSLWGSNGQALYSNLIIPNWLWEGDAVETETRLNPIGRSKIPEFYLPLHAYLLEYGIPTYGKMMGKSYRQLVPNHYVFGQYLSQYIRQKQGELAIGLIWQKSLLRPYPFAFSSVLKERTGLSIDQLSHLALKELRDSIQLRRLDGSDKSEQISPKASQTFTSYKFPCWVSDDTFVAIKSGFSTIPVLVELSHGQEKVLTKLGPISEMNMLSASKEWVIWSEIKFDVRWGQKQGTRLVLFNRKMKEKIFWDGDEKWINPSISQDNKLVLTLVQNNVGSSHLLLLDLETRQLIKKIPISSGEQVLHARLADQNRMVYVVKNQHQKSIRIMDLERFAVIHEFHLGSKNIGAPFLKGDFVYFNQPFDGIDQIVRIHVKNKQQQVITHAPFGAYSAQVISNDDIIYQAYRASGDVIMVKKLGNETWSTLVQSKPTPVLQELKPQYVSQKYSKWNIFNVYSWGPLIAAQGNQLEVSLLSKNVTNTLQAGIGYQYDPNEQSGTQFARFSYQGLFPVIDASFQNSQRSTSLYVDKRAPFDSLRTDNWMQTKGDIGIRLPFNLTHSAFAEYLTLSSTYSFFQVSGYDLPSRFKSEAFNGLYSSMTHAISYSKLLNRAYRDVQSPWGYQIGLHWQGTPFSQNLNSEIWSAQWKVFVPGLFRHHGISLRGAYQQQSNGNYTFASTLALPRGYTTVLYNRLFTFSADYKFPIANTDFNIGRLLYVKRLKGNFFFDASQGENIVKDGTSTTTFQSFGVDLSSQFHLMRFSQTFEIGVRCLYKSQTKQIEWYPLVIDIGF
ncbi:BamA/TamA family outer membrane protein [Aquirufa salirivi]|uniref:Peptidase MA-like domain-containing protein n=1 Tax=Aquirufa salirivi TaxID=3104729 RepID=A0ABW8RSW8_9BACT